MGIKVPKEEETKESKLIEKLKKRFGDKEIESLLKDMKEKDIWKGLPPGERKVRRKGGKGSPSQEYETVLQHIKSGGSVKKKRKAMNKGGSVKSYNY